jgi:pimeloyl-ACP methyl ester carboxylesterase
MVRHRHVYHLAGYDPVECESQYRRFTRELQTFKRTWNVDASVSPLERAPADQWRACWKVNARGPGWQTSSVHELFMWDDIVRDDMRRPRVRRFWDALLAFSEFIVTGTLFRYFAASLRYAIFFLVPIVQLAIFAGAGWLVAKLLVTAFGLSGMSAVVVGWLAGIAAFFLLLRWPGGRWRVEQMLNDWVFAREYLYRRRADLEGRLDAFAAALAAEVRQAGLDEIVLVGHSMGAMLCIDVLDRALAIDPDLGRRGPALCLLTVGATIPKFTLHPAARRLRAMVARIVSEPSIAWEECQGRDDIISFYKFDPAALERVPGERFTGKPLIRRVQLHEMLTPEAISRHRYNYLRVHYQVVMANDKQAPYDYFLMGCGPVPFRSWALAPVGLLEFMDPDGSCKGSALKPALVSQHL